jgi:hypothetical protein
MFHESFRIDMLRVVSLCLPFWLWSRCSLVCIVGRLATTSAEHIILLFGSKTRSNWISLVAVNRNSVTLSDTETAEFFGKKIELRGWALSCWAHILNSWSLLVVSNLLSALIRLWMGKYFSECMLASGFQIPRILPLLKETFHDSMFVALFELRLSSRTNLLGEPDSLFWLEISGGTGASFFYWTFNY